VKFRRRRDCHQKSYFEGVEEFRTFFLQNFPMWVSDSRLS
jgi:hypothetical protein